MQKIFIYTVSICTVVVVALGGWIYFWGEEKSRIRTAEYELFRITQVHELWAATFGNYIPTKSKIVDLGLGDPEVRESYLKSLGLEVIWTAEDLPLEFRDRIGKENWPYLSAESYMTMMLLTFENKVYVFGSRSKERPKMIGVFETPKSRD